jgi:hypothetical protein
VGGTGGMENEELIKETMAAIEKDLRKNIGLLEDMTEASELSIEKMEAMLGKIMAGPAVELEKMFNKIAKRIPEKEVIRKKKPS